MDSIMASKFDTKQKVRYIKAGFSAGTGKWALPQQKAALVQYLMDEGLDDQAKDDTFIDNLLWLIANPGAMRNLLVDMGLIDKKEKESDLAKALKAELG